MGIDAGRLNQRISIYKPVANSLLRSEEDFELFSTVWADVRAVTAREQMRSGLEIQDGQFTIQIRYLTGVSMDCIIKYGSLYYEIDSIQVDPQQASIIIAVSYHANLNQNEKFTT